MLNLTSLDRVTLTFLGGDVGSHESIVVTDVVLKQDGEPMWIEGYSVNLVGRRPNPTTIYPWTAIKSIRPVISE